MYRFVSSNKAKENLKTSSADDNEHNKELGKPDYDEDQDQPEEEEMGKLHHQQRIRFSEPICIYFYYLNNTKKLNLARIKEVVVAIEWESKRVYSLVGRL